MIVESSMSLNRIATVPSGAACARMSGRSVSSAETTSSIEVVTSTPVRPWASSRSASAAVDDAAGAHLARAAGAPRSSSSSARSRSPRAVRAQQRPRPGRTVQSDRARSGRPSASRSRSRGRQVALGVVEAPGRLGEQAEDPVDRAVAAGRAGDDDHQALVGRAAPRRRAAARFASPSSAIASPSRLIAGEPVGVARGSPRSRRRRSARARAGPPRCRRSARRG